MYKGRGMEGGVKQSGRPQACHPARAVTTGGGGAGGSPGGLLD